MFQEVVGHRKNMQLADYVLTIALGGAFALGLLFIVMRREANVNIQSGMNAEGLMQQHSGMGFGKAKKNLDRKLASVQDMLRQQNQGDRALQKSASTNEGNSKHPLKKRHVVNENSKLNACRPNKKKPFVGKKQRRHNEQPSATKRRHALQPSEKQSGNLSLPKPKNNASQK